MFFAPPNTGKHQPKIICIGEENEPGVEHLPENCVWCVYWYRGDSYDGDGHAYAFDGKDYWEQGIGHISCYDAWDNTSRAMWSRITKRELLEMHLAGDDATTVAVRDAVNKLL